MLAMLLLLLAILAPSVEAESYANVTDVSGYTRAVVNNPNPADRLNLRVNPNTSAESLGRFYNGVQVDILETNADDSWARVRIGNEPGVAEGWMLLKYLDLDAHSAASQTRRSVAPIWYILTDTNNPVHLRAKPSLDSEPIAACRQGGHAAILGWGSSWHFVNYDGYTGYLKASWLTDTPPDNPNGIGATIDPNIWGHIDGSTACIPLAEAAAKALHGLTDYDISTTISFNTTSYAYSGLIDGGNYQVSANGSIATRSVSLILVTPPSADEALTAAAEGVALDYIPIARDALVLLDNARNPVQSITLAQAQDVYQGKTTNWSELGGGDEPILAYQRSMNSGSQTLFEQLLMRGKTPMEPISKMRLTTMSFLIDAISAYDNGLNALGYSMYYYVNNMYGSERLRMLTVDGVAPTAETIATGEYPLCAYYYAVLRSDEPEDSNARKLVRWLTSAEGQKVVAQAGYVPLMPEAIRRDMPPVTVQAAYGTGGGAPKRIEDADAEVIDYGWWTEEPSLVYNAEKLRLSDVFFDGFNYADYINWYVASRIDDALKGSLFGEYWEEGANYDLTTVNGPARLYTGDGDDRNERTAILKRAFGGFPADYKSFRVLPGKLVLDVFENSDDFGGNLRGYVRPWLTIPLLPVNSPYGENYRYFDYLPVKVGGHAIAKPILNAMGEDNVMLAAEKINARIDEMFADVKASAEYYASLDNGDNDIDWNDLYPFYYPFCHIQDNGLVMVLFTNDYGGDGGPRTYEDMYVGRSRLFWIDTGDDVDWTPVYNSLNDSPYADYFIDRQLPKPFDNGNEETGKPVPLDGYAPPDAARIEDAWCFSWQNSRGENPDAWVESIALRFTDENGQVIRMYVPRDMALSALKDANP
jgi:phosphate transport system substrate-binding protein